MGKSKIYDREIKNESELGFKNMNFDNKIKLNLFRKSTSENSCDKKETLHSFYSYKDTCNSNIKSKLKDLNQLDFSVKIKPKINLSKKDNENINNNLDVFMKKYNSYSTLANKK